MIRPGYNDDGTVPRTELVSMKDLQRFDSDPELGFLGQLRAQAEFARGAELLRQSITIGQVEEIIDVTDEAIAEEVTSEADLDAELRALVAEQKAARASVLESTDHIPTPSTITHDFDFADMDIINPGEPIILDTEEDNQSGTPDIEVISITSEPEPAIAPVTQEATKIEVKTSEETEPTEPITEVDEIKVDSRLLMQVGVNRTFRERRQARKLERKQKKLDRQTQKLSQETLTQPKRRRNAVFAIAGVAVAGLVAVGALSASGGNNQSEAEGIVPAANSVASQVDTTSTTSEVPTTISILPADTQVDAGGQDHTEGDTQKAALIAAFPEEAQREAFGRMVVSLQNNDFIMYSEWQKDKDPNLVQSMLDNAQAEIDQANGTLVQFSS